MEERERYKLKAAGPIPASATIFGQFTAESVGDVSASTAGRVRPVERHGVAPQQSHATAGLRVSAPATLNVASATGMDGEQVAFEQSGCSAAVAQSAWDRQAAGSIPANPTIAGDARMDERLICNQDQAGSIPVAGPMRGRRGRRPFDRIAIQKLSRWRT